MNYRRWAPNNIASWTNAMSRQLLCSWLNVPEWPWPPSHYALLGLQPGEGGTDEVEHRVLELMDKLRHHQLMNPDLVTEGMNLLAKAMNCLTDPEGRLQYDQSIGLRSKQPLAAVVQETDEVPVVDVIEVPAPTRAVRSSRVVEPAAPPVPSNGPEIYSLDESDAAFARRLSATGAAPPEDIIIPELAEPETLSLPDDELPDDDADRFVDESPRREQRSTPATTPTQEDEARRVRRQIYAQIVRVRRVLRVWEQLRVFLEDPNETFTRRTSTVEFMACLGELRPLLPTVVDLVGGQNDSGNLVAALARQPLVVDTFKQFLPSQRGALAQDCRAAHDELEGRYRRLREEIRTLTRKPFKRRVWRPMCRAMKARPEWFLLFMALLSLAIALIHSKWFW